MNLEEFVTASNRADTVAALFDVFRTAMAARGFDYVMFSLLTEHPTLGRTAAGAVLHNFPAIWMKRYQAMGYETIDPVRQHLPLAESVFTWESLRNRQKLTKAQEQCLHDAAAAGLKNGIGIAVRGPRGALAGIGAASSADGADIGADNLSKAFLLSRQFYGRFLALESKPHATVEVVLTRRELEVLKHSASGKTRSEVAALLAISEESIKFHLRNARRKLGSANALAAILKALNTGIVQI